MTTVTYNIVIENQSGYSQRYLFFSDVPKPRGNLGEVYSNVWLTAPGVGSPRGSAKFTVPVENFAVCGTTPGKLEPGVSVSTNDYAEVALAGQDQPGTVPQMQIVDEGAQFVPPPKDTKMANSFGIDTATYLPVKYPDIYCGYGKKNKAGKVVPVAVWAARPSQKYICTPVITYYVSTGDYEPGTTVDKTTFGKVGTIDFTKALAGQTVATIIHTDSSVYSAPTFSYPDRQFYLSE